MNNIKVIHPYLAYLAIPLAVIVLIGFFLLPKRNRKKGKNIASLALHLVMAVTLSLAFMDIQYMRPSTDTQVYILADCSASEEPSRAKLDEAVNRVASQAKNQRAKVGLVAFAKDSELLARAGGRIPSVSRAFDNADFDQSATDLESALLYTNSLFDAASTKRIVLISDGIQTDNSAVNALSTLLNNNVSIDAIYLNEEEGDEIALTGLDYHQRVYQGREESVSVSIRSKKEADSVHVNLTQEGVGMVASVETNIIPGLNVVKIPLNTDALGVYNYQIGITGDMVADTYLENNTLSFRQEVTDEFHVLFVANSRKDKEALDALGIYNDKTQFDTVYNGRPPYLLQDLMKYDEFILSDINVGALDNYETFLQNLYTCVDKYGKSLMTYGATYSGTEDSAVAMYNDILPVQYHAEEGKALVLLIDNSGSMESDNRITMAKQGAKAALENLNENDYVSIITFSDDVKIRCPLTPVKNKEIILHAINGITSDGGTSMVPGLTQSLNQLRTADFEYKHVIVLSDGEPFEPQSDLQTAVMKLSAANIITSFINISNPSGSALLTRLASIGGGTYYYAPSAASLVNLMVNSVSDEITNKAVTEDDNGGKAFDISIRNANDPSLVDVGTLPQIGGYNFCRMKSAATTVLTVQYNKNESDTQSGDIISSVVSVPLYAYWTFGEGKVASFTSSLSSSWSTKLRNSDNGKAFFSNVVEEIHPEYSSNNMLQFTYDKNGLTSSVHVAVNNGDNTGDMKIEVKDPNSDQTRNYTLNWDGTAYSGLVETPIAGTYNVSITYTQTAKKNSSPEVFTADAPLFFDYSKEYDVFDSANSSDLLYNLTRDTGKLALASEYEYEPLTSEYTHRSYRSTMLFFLLLTIVLFLVDIFIRKTDFKPRKKKVTPSAQA